MAPPAALNLADLEAIARGRLDPAAYDYFAGGADDELSLRDNRAAFERRRLTPRALVDVAVRDLSVEAFGQRLPTPIVVAPTALHRLAHPEGEVATSRGAMAAGALMTLSTLSTVALEDVAAASPGAPRWFQLYCRPERRRTARLVERAVAAGYTAVVVTVDVPYAGRRERDLRNRFEPPPDVQLANVEPGVGVQGSVAESPFLLALTGLTDPSLDWDDLAWLRSVTRVPLLVKGLLRAADALRAVEAGADGIWVSNHGGRQLDGAIAPLDALPSVAAAVEGRALVVVDGGIRRGTDALKALALGADLVAVGRPVLWGLAIDGAAGVEGVLAMLRDELSLAMALAGCRSLAEVTPDLVVPS